MLQELLPAYRLAIMSLEHLTVKTSRSWQCSPVLMRSHALRLCMAALPSVQVLLVVLYPFYLLS